MKNKGFTLIELLAVIIILAIIALIATPMILGVIDSARKESAKSSALGYIDAVEKQIAIDMLLPDKVLGEITPNKMLNVEEIKEELTVKGTAPEKGIIVLDEDSTVANGTCLVIKIGNDEYNVYYNGKEVEIKEKECTAALPPTKPTMSVTNTPNETLSYYKSQAVALSYPTGENLVYYVKTTRNAEISENVTNECGTDTTPGICTEIEETTTLTANSWYVVNNSNAVVTYAEDSNEEATLYSLAYNTQIDAYSEELSININKIDTQAPELTLGDAASSVSKITIPFTVTDSGSAVTTVCKYGTEDGKYTENGQISDNNCVLNNLNTETTYYYQVCAYDESKNEKCEVSSESTMSLIGATVTLNQGNDQISEWNIISNDTEKGTVNLLKATAINNGTAYKFHTTDSNNSNIYANSYIKTVVDAYGETLGISDMDIRLITVAELTELGFAPGTTCPTDKYPFLCTYNYWTETRYVYSGNTQVYAVVNNGKSLLAFNVASTQFGSIYARPVITVPSNYITVK